MKRLPAWQCGILTCLIVTSAANADTLAERRTETFQAALDEFDRALDLPSSKSAQARILYRSAAQRLESIVAEGIENGYLEYNLGNCYLQAGQLGKAILHYRRAERLIPTDPYLADNLREAKSRCLAKIEATRQSSVLRSLFFWHYGVSLSSRITAAVCLSAIFWALVAGRCLWQRRGLTIAMIAAGLAATATAGSIATTYWCDAHTPAGVITGLDVVARKGPGTGYPRQFAQPLQAGVEFTRTEARAHRWWQICLPDGKQGWIESDKAELVTTPDAPTAQSPQDL